MTKVNVSALARAANLKPALVHQRLFMDWSLEDALSTPKNGRRPTPSAASKPKIITVPPLTQKNTFRWDYFWVAAAVCVTIVFVGFAING